MSTVALWLLSMRVRVRSLGNQGCTGALGTANCGTGALGTADCDTGGYRKVAQPETHKEVAQFGDHEEAALQMVMHVSGGS